MNNREGRSFGIVLSLCLAIFTCFVSNNLSPRFENHEESVERQLAIFRGEPYHQDGKLTSWAPFQSRILFPALLTLAVHVKVISASQWYLLLRVATAVAAFITFWTLLTTVGKANAKIAAMGMGVLAYGLIFTFNHGWEHPTDFFDIIFFSIFLWAALRHHRFALFAAVLLGTTNHQTAALAGFLWLCLYGIDSKWKLQPLEILYSGVLMASSYLLSWAIRAKFYGVQSIGYEVNGYMTFQQFREFLSRPTSSSWPVLLFAMVTPLILWLRANRRVLSDEDRRLLVAVCLILGSSSIVAYWSELRSVFLAPLIVTTFVLTAAEARAADSLVEVDSAVPKKRTGGLGKIQERSSPATVPVGKGSRQ
jgi:hypothetical protein